MSGPQQTEDPAVSEASRANQRADSDGAASAASRGPDGFPSERAGGDSAHVEMTITPDRAFARAVWRAEVRQGSRTAGMGLLGAALLIATSLGAVVAEAPLWTVFGMIGLAAGVLLFVMVIAWPFQHRQREVDGLLQPIRYVLAPDAIEWNTDAGSVRLLWSAIRGVRLLPYAYQIHRYDGGPEHLICRTTLTALQQAQLRTYMSAHLAEKSTTTGA
jgi:hypothetical protein